MNRIISCFSVAGLVLIMSFGLFFSTADASSVSNNNKVESLDHSPNATSMKVSEVKRYGGIITPPSSIRYNKNNYTGTLYRD